MKWGRMAVLALAVFVAGAGVMAVVSPWTGQASVGTVDLVDDDQAGRRDENDISVEPVDDDDDGNNTGDRDRTGGDDGTNGGNNTGGGSNTGGGATT
jgi:hypothetical protein